MTVKEFYDKKDHGGFVYKWGRVEPLGIIILYVLWIGFLVFITVLAVLNKHWVPIMASIITFLLGFPLTIFTITQTIYFDYEKAYRKIGNRVYEWRWNDINEFETTHFRGNTEVRITTNVHDVQLIFNCTPSRVEKLLTICKNEKVTVDKFYYGYLRKKMEQRLREKGIIGDDDYNGRKEKDNKEISKKVDITRKTRWEKIKKMILRTLLVLIILAMLFVATALIMYSVNK